MKFKKVNGEKIDNLSEYVKNHLDSKSGEFQIYIGCDSLPPKGNVTSFITVVVLYDVGHGTHVICKKDKSDKIKAMYDRLWHEVELAVEVAQYLRDNAILEYRTKAGTVKSIDLQVHLDLNPDESFKSNNVYNAALGYVKSLGFEFIPKPTAFAATYMADNLVRHK